MLLPKTSDSKLGNCGIFAVFSSHADHSCKLSRVIRVD